MQDNNEKMGRPDIDPLREQMMKRTDLTPFIKDIQEGTFQPTVSDQDLELTFDIFVSDKGFDVNEEELHEATIIWEAAKVERNSEIAIFSQEIWEYVELRKEKFVPRVAEEQDVNRIFKLLNFDTAIFFNQAMDQWAHMRESSLQRPEEQWTPLDHAYARLKKIIHFGGVNKISPDSIEGFIGLGVNTAFSAMWGTLRMIGELARIQNVNLTADEYKEIFNRAFGPVVMPFASMNKEIGVPLLDKIGLAIDTAVSGVDTTFFKLEKDSQDKFKLVMDHEALFSLKDEHGQAIITKNPSSETTWCPARYGVGEDKNVIRESSGWIVEIADQVVFPKLEEAGKARDLRDQDQANRFKNIFKGK